MEKQASKFQKSPCIHDKFRSIKNGRFSIDKNENRSVMLYISDRVRRSLTTAVIVVHTALIATVRLVDGELRYHCDRLADVKKSDRYIRHSGGPIPITNIGELSVPISVFFFN